MSERLRTPPRERFADPVHVFSISDAAKELASEPASTIHGHRQVALYHNGGFTVALFRFDAGGTLDDHSARGQVMIQAIEGRLKVTTEHTPKGEMLEPGQFIVLAPGVVHAVTAEVDSLMLLTVALTETA